MVGQGHWVGLEANPEDFFGFIYIIRDLTSGYKYIGKKQYWALNRSAKFCKSRVFDKGSPKWKPSCWVQSDWKSYKGSSQHLKSWMAKHKDHVYEFEILLQARSKGVLSYLEVREQWDRRVLNTKSDDGEFTYFNRQIGAIKFRPPAWFSEETRKKISEAGKGRVLSAEHKRRISESNTGKRLSDETKGKISESKVGTKLSEDHKRKISEGHVGMTGKKHSDETKSRMSENHAGMRGKGHSDETKKKIRQTRMDKTVYLFYSKALDEYFEGTRCEFMEHTGARRDCTGSLVRGSIKSSKGWCLIKEVPHGYKI